jgi:hypothetical protein
MLKLAHDPLIYRAAKSDGGAEATGANLLKSARERKTTGSLSPSLANCCTTMPPKRINLKAIGLNLVNAKQNAPRADHPIRKLSENEGFLRLPIELVRPNPDQPRQHFDEASLADLTASVKEMGVLQPVLARKDPKGDGYF